MKLRTAASIAVVTLAACGWIARPDAQGRGGRGAGPGGPGGGPGAGPAAPRNGRIEPITVHGKSLEGNLEGDSPDRPVLVYLPPSYLGDQNRRFPVVYLLHGYGGTEATFTERLANIQESGDKLDPAQGFSSAIYVMPGAYTLHKGSMYSNSVTTGNWEDFIANDLVAYIDSHYRTLPVRMSRGLGGHSMGGYGALKIGMKRPEVFSSLYLMSSCCLNAQRTPSAQSMAAAEAVKTRAQAEELAKQPGFGVSTTLASAAAWSPNPSRPPLFFDLPMENGKLRPEIVAKWVANAPLETVPQYVDNLKKYYSIGIEVGTKDTLYNSNVELHQLLTKLGIRHVFEEYDGDHTNRIKERIERNTLPFFARYLASPVNPTSPSAGADLLAPAKP
jgi:S-formylglutathione hydrolase